MEYGAEDPAQRGKRRGEEGTVREEVRPRFPSPVGLSLVYMVYPCELPID